MMRCFTLFSMTISVLFVALNSQLSTLNSVHAASTDTIVFGITPRDIWPPRTILDFAVTSAAEGTVTLNWTAPYEDRDVQIPKANAVKGYFVKYATFSIADVAGDSTTWWNNASYTSAFFGAQDPTLAEAKGINGLEPGATLYFVNVSSDNADMKSELTATATRQVLDVVPGLPANLTTLSVSESTISITWNPPSPNPGDLDYYRIFRASETPPVWVEITTVPVSITTYTFANLTAGVTFQFKITVTDRGLPTFIGTAFESQSSTISSRLKVTGPTAFSAVNATTDSLTYQWIDNSLVETGFRIYSSTGGIMGSTSSVAGAGNIVQWTETGLLAGGQYLRYVAAVQGTELSESSGTLTAYTLPNPPTNLVRSTSTISSITLNWNANNNASDARYIVQRATWPFLSFVQIDSTTLTTSISTGLAEFTTYTYRLKARNGGGTESSEIELSTMSNILKPSAVNNLVPNAGPYEGSIDLRWVAPGDDGTIGNIPNGVYDIRFATYNITSEADFDLLPQTTHYQRLISTDIVAGAIVQYIVTGLNIPNTLIYFTLRTRDEIPGNFSNISNVVNTFVQVDITSPSRVNNLVPTLLSTTSVRLTWSAPGDDGFANWNGFGAYDIRYATFPLNNAIAFGQARNAADFGTIPAPPQTPGSQENMVLSGLVPDTTYYFALLTRDERPNYSDLSNGATLFMPDVLAPSALQNLKAIANTSTGRRIDLSWTNPTDKDLKGIRILVRTDLYTTLAGDTTAQKFDLTFSSPLTQPPTSFAHTDLTVGTTYFYSLFAFDDETSANYSDPAFASTTPVKSKLPAPAKPKGVKGARSGDGQSFIITWDSVTTRVTGEPMEPLELSSYTIYRMESIQGATNQIFSVVAGTTTLTDTTLAGRALFYKVRAVNLGGTESEDSDVVSSDVDGTVMVMMDDGISFLAVPGDLKAFLDSQNLTLRGTRDLSQEGGATFKSMKIEVRDGTTGELKKGYLFDKPIQVAMGYSVDASGRVSNGAPAVQFNQPMPKASDAPNAFSLYWFNGAQWLKLGTTVDTNKKTATVKSKHSGAYQLRLIQQALSSQMNAAYPRTITPNSDGINDVVFFLFENPTDAPVKGTIYDMKSAKVADAKAMNVFGEKTTVLSWDGTDDTGSVVTGGVYLYRIEIGDKSFTGTVVVAR